MTTRPLRTGSVAIPESTTGRPPTAEADQDAALADLGRGAAAWSATGVAERIALLDALAASAAEAAERWVRAGCAAKGIAPDAPVAAEEWLSGPYVTIRHLRLYARTLADVARKGTPGLPGRAVARPDGRVVAPVFPTDPLDRILFRGVTAHTRMLEGVDLDGLAATMAVAYRGDPPAPRVALVLGAGNVSSIGPLDALHKLFVEGEVVLLKMNPVNEAMGPILADALRPLIERDALRVVFGGAAVGDRLCRHEGVDSIHITGSDRTHDAIVWGPGDEGRERMLRGEPRNTKPITSELGNVSPFIVVPGRWSANDLRYQARSVASSLTTNAGFNCNATRVVVTHAGWEQRGAFLEAIRSALAETPARRPYYPGAVERHAAFVAAHPDAYQVGPAGEGRVPWTLIEGVDAGDPTDVCFQTEAWCGVMSETAIAADDVPAFLSKAVRFSNQTLWGTLNATLVVHPRSTADAAVARAVEKAVDELRYGTVAVNVWAAASFVLGSTTWGAFPGHTHDDVQSGIGTVHNTYMFDRPEKTVIRAPFRMVPEPAWFPSNRSGHVVARHLTSLAERTTPLRLARVLLAAIGLRT